MSELVATAERLRVVKHACADFLILWAVDEMMNQACTGDQLWQDVQSSVRPDDHHDIGFSKCGRRLDD
jgi:hypothetical protein